MGVDLSAVEGKIHTGEYLPHVSVLAKSELVLELAAVDSRGRLLADLAWRRLAPWLGLSGDA